MAFTFKRGQRESTSVLLALAGASGSGKTFTAILLALGLAYPDMTPDQINETVEREGRSRVCVIDSEGGRALHYAPKPGEVPNFKDNFPFEYAELTPPFSPDAYKEAVVAANDAGFLAVIVDSMSHEWESEGGILEWANQLEAGVPKPGIENPEAWKKEHWIVRPVKPPGQWKEPKRAHKIMVNRFLQCRCHLIFCLRAEEKMKLVQEQGQNGKTFTKVVPAEERPLNERWEMICEKRFAYEMTASFVLLPGNPGVGIPLKLQKQHRPCFPEGEQIGFRSGECLAHWATGTIQTPPPSTAPPTSSTPPTSSNPKEDEAAAKRKQWVTDYIALVDSCLSLDALIDLQDSKSTALAKFKDGDAEQWRRILDAHASAQDRLGHD